MDPFRYVQDYALTRAGVKSAFIKPNTFDDEVTIVMTVTCTVSGRDWVLLSPRDAVAAAMRSIDEVTQPVHRPDPPSPFKPVTS